MEKPEGITRFEVENGRAFIDLPEVEEVRIFVNNTDRGLFLQDISGTPTLAIVDTSGMPKLRRRK